MFPPSPLSLLPEKDVLLAHRPQLPGGWGLAATPNSPERSWGVWMRALSVLPPSQPAPLYATPGHLLDKFIKDFLQPDRNFLGQIATAVDIICRFLQKNCFPHSATRVQKTVKVSTGLFPTGSDRQGAKRFPEPGRPALPEPGGQGTPEASRGGGHLGPWLSVGGARALRTSLTARRWASWGAPALGYLSLSCPCLPITFSVGLPFCHVLTFPAQGLQFKPRQVPSSMYTEPKSDLFLALTTGV